jgi:O-succinylhomoserine sulfhydrylase
MQRHCENALKLAKALEKMDGIVNVKYPHLPTHPQYDLAKKQMSSGGSMIAFETIGNKNDCFKFLNNLQLIDISNNLGDSKSLITHPATTTHGKLSVEAKEAAGIQEGLIRVSVGLEDINDIIGDISRGLDLI